MGAVCAKLDCRSTSFDPPRASPIDEEERRLLDNPVIRKVNPTLDDRIEAIRLCTAVGSNRASRLNNQSANIVLGETGTGKSTFINFLNGCRMRKIKNMNDGDVIAAEGGVTSIGHRDTSETFLPRAVQAAGRWFLDCPGYNDTRGSAINISNAVNTKLAVYAAREVRVVVLLNYWGICKDTKCLKMRGLLKYLQSLFGGTNELLAHKEAIILGITKVPIELNGRTMSLDRVQKLVKTPNDASDEDGRFINHLRQNSFMFDPLGNADEHRGWSSRQMILDRISGLPHISDVRAVFHTVLSSDDKVTLQNVIETLANRLTDAMEASRFHYDTIGSTMAQLRMLDCIGSADVQRWVQRAEEAIKQGAERLKVAAGDHLDMDSPNIRGARSCLENLERLCDALAGNGSQTIVDEVRNACRSLESRINQAANRNEQSGQRLPQEIMRLQQELARIRENMDTNERRAMRETINAGNNINVQVVPVPNPPPHQSQPSHVEDAQRGRVPCSTCGREFRLARRFRGQNPMCNGCRENLQNPDDLEALSEDSETSYSRERVSCSTCGHQFQLSVNFAGRNPRCHNCHADWMPQNGAYHMASTVLNADDGISEEANRLHLLLGQQQASGAAIDQAANYRSSEIETRNSRGRAGKWAKPVAYQKQGNVHFTGFHPERFQVERQDDIYVYMYPSLEGPQAMKDAIKVSGNPDIHPTQTVAAVLGLAKGTMVQLRPELKGCSVQPEMEVMIWNGEMIHRKFVVMPGPAAFNDGMMDGHVNLMVNGVAVGEIRIKASISRSPKRDTDAPGPSGHHPSLQAGEFLAYRYVVLAYAPKDTVLAQIIKEHNRCNQELFKWGPLTIYDNQLPTDVLMAGRFQIMWSKSAAEDTTEVDRMARLFHDYMKLHCLSEAEISEAVIPCVWETPNPPLPEFLPGSCKPYPIPALAILGSTNSLHNKMDALGSKVDELLAGARQQLAALSRIHMMTDRSVPGLLCLLPSKQESTLTGRSLARAASLFNSKLRLYFVCPVSGKMARTNDGHGFELTVTREWLRVVQPYLSRALKCASMVAKCSRLLGFPIPDLAEVEENLRDWLVGQLQELQEVIGLHNASSEDAANLLEDTIQDVVGNLASTVMDNNFNLDENEANKLCKSTEEVERLLETTVGKDWAKKSGLVRVVSDDASHIAWVLPGECEVCFRTDGVNALLKLVDKEASIKQTHGQQCPCLAPKPRNWWLCSGWRS